MTDPTAGPFCEYETAIALGDSPLEQGDVMQFLQNAKFPDGWHNVLGVVVTANCDLSREKNWGLITYVPAIPVDLYIQCFTISKYLKSEANKAETQVRDVLGRSGGAESARRAIEMAELGYPPEEATVLLGNNPSIKAKTRFTQGYSLLQNIQLTSTSTEAVKGSSEFWQAMKGHVKQMDVLRNETEGTNNKRLRGYIKSTLANLPGDVFYLSAPSPLHCSGYIVVLRFIGSIDDGAVALRIVDEMRDPIHYSARRVSRLSTLYTHRVVQQMASVFTDIGLPSEYEQARDTHFDVLIDILGD